MIFYPMIALDNESYFNVVDYVLANDRFLNKMGTDIISSTTPFMGLDGNLYFSALKRQAADLKYIQELNSGLSRR